MKKNIILIMIITVFMKFLGFGREIALTYFYGASSVSDVYLIAQTIPNTLFALVGSGLATTFIPIFNRVREDKGEEEAKKFSSNVMNFVVILSVLIIIAVLIFTPQVVRIFASGFTGATMQLAVTFTRISIFGIIFAGVIYILNAYLQLKNKFIIPALISLPMNLVIIFSFVVANQLNDIFLAYGIVASLATQLVFILPSLIKNGFKYRFILDFKDVYLKEMILLSLPVILGSSVNQLNVLVDKNIASNVAVGGISALNYAYRLSGFIQGLFVVPIITVIYPNLSKKVIDKDNAGLQKVISDSITYISLLVIPASIGAMALARPIIELLFLRGEFDAVAASLTTSALFYYAIGMLAFALRDVFSRVFYAYNDTKIPTINAMIGVAINIVLNLILSRFLGIGGLALATSLSAIITTALLIRSLKIKKITFGYKSIMKNVVKIFIASLIMGAITILLFNGLKGLLGNNVTLILSIGVGALAYLVTIILLGIDEVKEVISSVKGKVFKK